MNESAKRNRSGNFDQDDIELFLNLVNDNKALVESSKQEDKKKGWGNIHSGFNENCTGIKRNIPALKMKLKNLKAQNKRMKLEPSEVLHESELNASTDSVAEQKQKATRKRSKMFAVEESMLLQELVERHLYSLDTSYTRDSLELRHKAWRAIADEFNKAKVGDVERDINELRIKHKNMRAQRINLKNENEVVEVAYVEEEHIPDDADMPENVQSKIASTKNNEATPVHTAIYRVVPARPPRSSAPPRNYAAILDDLDSSDDFSDDDDFAPQPVRKQPRPAPALSEEERIRKENLLLKNAVLRKKERLLELQIALAERNLRRHQFQ